MTAPEFWDRMGSRGPATVVIDGQRVSEGSRVRLRPRATADIMDLALTGQMAVVERVEQDEQGGFQLAVTIEADPGRDLGEALLTGHRFFFAVEDVEPVTGGPVTPTTRGVLVAGIGNVFLGDDGFGVEVVRRLAGPGPRPGVEVVDFGIRGMDLVYALQRDYGAVIFVDAAVRGQPPGTLTVLDPELPEPGTAAVQTHGMDPVAALALARSLGRIPPVRRVVCCEPARVLAQAHDEDLTMTLSPPVRAAVDPAAALVRSLIAELGGGGGE